MNIIIINGPNLNLLGKREPELYGKITFEQYFEELKALFPGLGLSYYQSNVEGELINKIQEMGYTHDGMIFNPGAYTHTSVALADAVAAITTPVVEVHISNIFSREDFRHVSFVGKYCKGSISGFGLKGYEIAVKSFVEN